MVLTKEAEGATEEDPCCVSALLGWFSNAPVAVGSTLHAIASTASSRSVLPLTLLRACFGARETDYCLLHPVGEAKKQQFPQSVQMQAWIEGLRVLE